MEVDRLLLKVWIGKKMINLLKLIMFWKNL